MVAITWRAALLGIALVPLLSLLRPSDVAAALVRRLGLDHEFATFIVELLISKGTAMVVSLFPGLAPFVGILQTLLAYGAEFAVGF